MTLQHELFESNLTTICVNNRTDPFLNPSTTKATLRYIEMLDQAGITNPVIVTSKLRLGEVEARRLESIKNLTIFVFVTYSRMPRRIEPLAGAPQMDTLRSLASLHAPRLVKVHYWGPLIDGCNADDETLAATLHDVIGLADCSVAVGLKADSAIVTQLRADNVEPPDRAATTKRMPSELVSRVARVRERLAPNYPMFRHTSCAVSWRMGWPDYNAHWIDEMGCVFRCPNQERCAARGSPTIEEVEAWLGHMGLRVPFTIGPDIVRVEGTLKLEEVAFLRNILRFKVEAREVVGTEMIEWVEPPLRD